MSLSLEAGEGAESSGETRNASSQGPLTRSSQLIQQGAQVHHH